MGRLRRRDPQPLRPDSFGREFGQGNALSQSTTFANMWGIRWAGTACTHKHDVGTPRLPAGGLDEAEGMCHPEGGSNRVWCWTDLITTHSAAAGGLWPNMRVPVTGWMRRSPLSSPRFTTNSHPGSAGSASAGIPTSATHVGRTRAALVAARSRLEWPRGGCRQMLTITRSTPTRDRRATAPMSYLATPAGVSRRAEWSARTWTQMLAPERAHTMRHQYHHELCVVSRTPTRSRPSTPWTARDHASAIDPEECDDARDPSQGTIPPRCRARVGRNWLADAGGSRRTRSRRT